MTNYLAELQLKDIFKSWMVEAGLSNENKAMTDNHIPHILKEEDDLRTACSTFGWDNITQLNISKRELYSFTKPWESRSDRQWQMSDLAM